jgi:hypothetical protein
MTIEVNMALGLVFNAQAAVRHLQDGRCQQTVRGSPPVTHDRVGGLCGKREKPSDSSPRTNDLVTSRPSRGCWLTNSKRNLTGPRE